MSSPPLSFFHYKTWTQFFSLDAVLAKEVLHLAYPVVLGLASITAIGLTDTAMVGRLGAEALAATGQAAIIFWGVHWVTRSIEVAAQALVSRRYGERQYAQCGKILDNALAIATALGTMNTFFLFFGGRTLMSFQSSHAEVIELAVGYIDILSCVLLFSALFFATRGFYSGIGKTRIFLITALLMLLINIIGNYAFIFGHFGAPKMGVRGAALASAVAFVIALTFIIAYTLGIGGRSYRREFNAFRFSNLDRSTIFEIVKLASPNAFRGVMVIGGLAVFYAMVDRLDVVQVAIVNVVLNIQSVSFMPGYGFGVAAATLIGQSLGANDPEKADRAGYEAVKLGMLFMGTLGVIFLIIPEWVVRLFTDDPIVIAHAVFPLRIVGLVQLVDAAGMIFSSALEGAGNTRWVMGAEIFVNWGIFLPLTYGLTFILNFDRFGPWIAWAMYMVVFGVMCFWKYRKGEWKHIKL